MLLRRTMLAALLASFGMLRAAELTDFTADGPAPVLWTAEGKGNRKVTLHVFLPKDHKASDQRAVTLWIHGGGWKSGTPDLMFPHCRYFASRGAIAISVAYRLAPDGGPVTVHDSLDDCRTAIRHLRSHARELGIDPSKIAVLGDSSGGHLAAALGTLPSGDAAGPSSVPDAMVLCNAALDLTAISWLKDLPGTPAGAAGTAAARLQALSPLRAVGKSTPPTLLLHGTADQVVPHAQSASFQKAMLAAGRPCQLVSLEGTGHAFLLPGYGKPAEIVRALVETDRFLTKSGYLAGAPTLREAGP